MKPEYLYGTPYCLKQSDEMFRMNSDTELLGRFMRLRRTDHVLDVGTNNGALLLYAAFQKPASLCGIDLFEEALTLARQNLRDNRAEAELICTKLQDLRREPFDVILCNPPFFPYSGKMVNENEFLAAARHEKYLTLEELFEHVSRLLKDNGRFYLVHRASRMNDIMEECFRRRMRPARIRIAYETKNKAAKSAVFEIVRGTGRQMVIEPPAFLDERSTYSERSDENWM
ncbi:MAG: methyltransferase [Solobacterium sp.]|nr:methyltransferase [Solobacterium sp.]